MQNDTQVQAFCNHHGYSDITPYEVIRVVSEKTVEIRRMSYTRDESVKLNFVAGGFAAHCDNQHEQNWFYAQDLNAPIIRARLTKKGWKSAYGEHCMSKTARKFHDYNY